MVVRAASALGEAVGKLYETAVRDSLRPVVESRGYTILPARLKNGTGNEYQIDAVVFDKDNAPIVIIDPKYIRYTKHNRDKGSWLCVAHYNLRKTHHSIRKSIAVLGGRWSTTSKALIRSFGVEVTEVSFTHIAGALKSHGVNFEWPETGGEAIAQGALVAFDALTAQEKRQIGVEMVSGIAGPLEQEVARVLDTDLTSIVTRVMEVEVLLKTSQGEIVVSSFDSVTGAMRALTDLIADRPDIRAFIQEKSE